MRELLPNRRYLLYSVDLLYLRYQEPFRGRLHGRPHFFAERIVLIKVSVKNFV